MICIGNILFYSLHIQILSYILAEGLGQYILLILLDIFLEELFWLLKIFFGVMREVSWNEFNFFSSNFILCNLLVLKQCNKLSTLKVKAELAGLHATTL